MYSQPDTQSVCHIVLIFATVARLPTCHQGKWLPWMKVTSGIRSVDLYNCTELWARSFSGSGTFCVRFSELGIIYNAQLCSRRLKPWRCLFVLFIAEAVLSYWGIHLDCRRRRSRLETTAFLHSINCLRETNLCCVENCVCIQDKSWLPHHRTYRLSEFLSMHYQHYHPGTQILL